jgi:diguanylate cyclase (GGDEF)-like protein
MAVALLLFVFDNVLSVASGGRYTASWYVAKVDSLAAASVVLFVLLYQVGSLYRRLVDMAAIDALTGLGNRRSLDIDLQTFVGDRRQRTQGSAMLLIDLDNFKAYNELHGHLAGDTALQTLAGVMRGSVFRSEDAVARYGGEEFTVLLHDTGIEGARAVAERIRQNVEATVLKIGAKATHVTVSIGVAYVSTRSNFSAESLLQAADHALYMAKANGRNRIYVESPEPAYALTFGTNV